MHKSYLYYNIISIVEVLKLTNNLKLLIYYYSQTGNTEKMARAVEEGAKSVVGVDVEMKYFVKPEEFAQADAVVIGMPTYYHDMSRDVKNLLETLI